MPAGATPLERGRLRVKNALLYPKLALWNLRSNRGSYLPFLGAASVIVCLFFTVKSVAAAPDLGRDIPGGWQIQALVTVGGVLLIFVCAPFLWYLNSFLMKRRRRELGLYAVLGLAGRQVGAILFFETLYSCLISVGLGLAAGILLSRGFAKLLLGLAGIAADYRPGVQPAAVTATLGLFGAVFLGCLGGNLLHLSAASPTQLMREDRSGEKDPRFGVAGGVMGLLLLAAGYYTAVRAWFDPNLVLLIIPVFFVSALLVALGTYGVFIFGSIWLLKGLKRSKRFYYRPENFITVSGMLHRMRKNGAGLAGICLFGTMTLVTLCCTLAVAMGRDRVMGLLGTPNDTRRGLGITLNLERMSPQELTTLFGTLAFLGLFFGAAFLLCTVVVMYYKQLTEGGEDRSSFAVMRRVGMSGGMVRAAARRQITLVFFLPLLMALLHLSFALPVMTRMFQVLCIEPATVLLAAGVGAAAFTALYLGAYWATARAYYRMVA